MFSYFFDFIRDLYKCLAFWGRYRQTQGRTDRQALRQVSFRLDETCSKPHISLALLSYWTLRLPSLHRAPWMQPQNGEREREREFGDDWSLPTILRLWMAMIGLLCFEMCLWCLHGLFFFAVIMDVTRCTHWAPCGLWEISSLKLGSYVTTCAIMSVNSVGFKPRHSLFHLVTLHYR